MATPSQADGKADRPGERADAPGAAGAHIVVLVHGIRTRAPWYVTVRDALQNAGYPTELTNYGRYDLFRFLLPVPFFKAWAARDVETDIRAAIAHHQAKSVSIIAHSFGTYVTAWIVKRRFDLKFRHVIFCGSVVKARFPFEQLRERIEGTIVNEVGTKDIWPILAESMTWGYGATGAFGFSRPRVFDRYHRGLSHSAFLNADFCRQCWIPVLRGDAPAFNDAPEKPPWWLQLLSVLQVKYIVLALIALWIASLVCRAPAREAFVPTGDVHFAGEQISRLVAEAEAPCGAWCPERLQCTRCMRTTAMESAVERLVQCRPRELRLVYRDPTVALERLSSGPIPCLEVSGVEQGRLEVKVDRSRADELPVPGGNSIWACGCNADAKQQVLKIVTQ